MVKDIRSFIRFMPQILPTNLKDRVVAALTAPDSCLWFPQLTYDLAQTEWQRLEDESGIIKADYGTERVILNDAGARRNIAYTLLIKDQVEKVKDMISVELLPKTLTDQYKESGVDFYTLEDLFSKGHIPDQMLDCLSDALNIIRQVPSLFATVVCLVKSLHLVKPELDDYDVSFSEPNITFSIFVSVPQSNHPINSLRVAEAIVHEAMHLQLTLVEKIVQLLKAGDSLYYSPWKEEYRTSQGVLHALYVFRVIESFLENVSYNYNSDTRLLNFIQTRRQEIKKQMLQVDSFVSCPDLTEIGARFVEQLIKKQDVT